MDKNKISLTIIKTTLTVTIAFCLVSSILGLVSLYSFKQMVETEIRLSRYGLMVSSNVTEKFASVSAETISTVYIVFVLIALNIILEMQWLSDATFLDEITLFTLLLTLPQNLIVEHINQIIQK